MDLLFPCFPYWSNILQLLTISIFFGVIILYIFKIDRKFTVVSLALLRNNRTKDQNLGSVMASMCSNGSCHLPFWSIWFIFLPGYAFFPQLRELPSVTMISLSLSLSHTHTFMRAHTHTHTFRFLSPYYLFLSCLFSLPVYVIPFYFDWRHLKVQKQYSNNSPSKSSTNKLTCANVLICMLYLYIQTKCISMTCKVMID
jgi:hypothetical protein